MPQEKSKEELHTKELLFFKRKRYEIHLKGFVMKKVLKISFVVLLTVLASWLIFLFMKKPLFSTSFFDKEIMNFYFNFEFSTILISLSMLVFLYLLADKLRLGLFNLKRIDGPVKPVPYLGLKEGERWKTIGLSIGGIITLVTALVVYFQVAHKTGISIKLFPEVPLLLLMALMNSFTEEVIYRLSYSTIVANEKVPAAVSELLSALIFGGVHYYGVAPSGIHGALMAAYFGWFLSKSINETGGFFWAWAVHFAQDTVILFFLFMRN